MGIKHHFALLALLEYIITASLFIGEILDILSKLSHGLIEFSICGAFMVKFPGEEWGGERG